ncbi:transposase-like protein [Escherichia coli]|uniref:Transposase-like protein n=1 Tax=Escherichia coli TaxID=562 RepID=A0A376U0A6_ECOLX|nr:transposase-like protein [Escherichia coli]
MQSLYEWLQGQMNTLSRHSDTAKAFTYLLKQWDALNEYCRNGWVEIDNNLCENALRVVALGRRNYRTWFLQVKATEQKNHGFPEPATP